MANVKAAKRYAKAFFDLVQEQKRLDLVRVDIKALRDVLDQSAELTGFLDNHRIAASRRKQILQQLFEGKVDELTLRLLLFLDEKKRLSQLREILQEISALYDMHSGLLKVQITSAFALSAQETAAIVEKLQTKLNKRIEPHLKTDPALIGGFKIQVADKIYDYSIDTMLENLNRKLVNA